MEVLCMAAFMGGYNCVGRWQASDITMPSLNATIPAREMECPCTQGCTSCKPAYTCMALPVALCNKAALVPALPCSLPQVVWMSALSCHDAGPLVMFYLTTASLYGLGVLWLLFVIVNALGW